MILTTLFPSCPCRIVLLLLLLFLCAHVDVVVCFSGATTRIRLPSHKDTPTLAVPRRRTRAPLHLAYHDHDDENDDDDDDDEPPAVDISQFRPPTASFGYNAGRSSPAQRKGMGLSGQAVVYVCTHCAAESVKWMGRCPTCKEWNTMQEHTVARRSAAELPQPWFGGASSSSWLDNHPHGDNNNNNNNSHLPIQLNRVLQDATRRQSRILIPNDEEFNNVLGGGLFPGSLSLVGGAPGVGKSTLLLQVAASLAAPRVGIGMGTDDSRTTKASTVGPVWYVSGEETPEQIAHRAQRLLVNDNDDPTTTSSSLEQQQLYIWQETQVDRLCHQVVQAQQQQQNARFAGATDNYQPQAPPGLLIIDSIQTMTCAAGGASAAGGITQVRACVGLFLRLAKSTGIPVVLVGHVTKSGAVAGPR